MSKIISPTKRLTLHSWMFAAARDLPKRPTHTPSLFSWCISCRQGDIWQRQREMEIKKNSNHSFIRITWSGLSMPFQAFTAMSFWPTSRRIRWAVSKLEDRGKRNVWVYSGSVDKNWKLRICQSLVTICQLIVLDTLQNKYWVAVGTLFGGQLSVGRLSSSWNK